MNRQVLYELLSEIINQLDYDLWKELFLYREDDSLVGILLDTMEYRLTEAAGITVVGEINKSIF